MSEIPDTTKAWIAGFFDGEGCINIGRQFPGNRATPRFILNVRVSNTAQPSVEVFQKVFGGRVYRLARKSWHSICFQWYIYGEAAAQFLRIIYPYLVVKREQAELALEFYDSCRSYTNTELQRGPHVMPLAEVERREELRSKILSYNVNRKRGRKTNVTTP